MRDQMTSHEQQQQQQQEEAARTSADAASITTATHPAASASAINTVVMTTYKHTSDGSAAAVSGGALSSIEATPADVDRCAPSNNAASTSSNIPVSISMCTLLQGYDHLFMQLWSEMQDLSATFQCLVFHPFAHFLV